TSAICGSVNLILVVGFISDRVGCDFTPVGRLAPCPGFVAERQRFVRRCHSCSWRLAGTYARPTLSRAILSSRLANGGEYVPFIVRSVTVARGQGTAPRTGPRRCEPTLRRCRQYPLPAFTG